MSCRALLQLAFGRDVVDVTMTPLTDRGNQLLDALEAKTGTPPHQMSADTGARTYSLECETGATTSRGCSTASTRTGTST